MARTARTVALDRDGLAEAMDDLRARLSAAGRDPMSVDVSFSCSDGGDPASEAFDPDTHIAGLADLAAMGVTWVQVGLPGDDLTRTVATIERYGRQVIAPCTTAT